MIMYFKKKTFQKYTLLVFIVCLLPISTYADFPAKALIEAFQGGCGVETDAFYDAIMNKEIDINEKTTINFLEEFSANDLALFRNTIFAKHGYRFKTQKLEGYFKQKSWYTPTNNVIKLSLKEEQIISIVKSVENCENRNFLEFQKLFVPIDLPYSYKEGFKQSKYIKRVYIRKFLKKDDHCYNWPFYSVGILKNNRNFVAILYDIQSLMTVPGIATFTAKGELIANKTFFFAGGDTQHYTIGKLNIDKNLVVHVKIKETNNGISSEKSETYIINKLGMIQKKEV